MRLIEILITKIRRKKKHQRQLSFVKGGKITAVSNTRETPNSYQRRFSGLAKRSSEEGKAGGGPIPNSFPRYHRHADKSAYTLIYTYIREYSESRAVPENVLFIGPLSSGSFPHFDSLHTHTFSTLFLSPSSSFVFSLCLSSLSLPFSLLD